MVYRRRSHHTGTLASVLLSGLKDRGRQDSNLRVKITTDFESTPVNTWVRPLMELSWQPQF